MIFYWQSTGKNWEFRIKNSSALLMKLRNPTGNQWEATCLHDVITFNLEGEHAAKLKASTWLGQVLTKVQADLEQHNNVTTSDA